MVRLGRPRVLIGGHEYFARKLAHNLSDFDQASAYAFLEPVAGLRKKVNAAFRLAAADLLYLIGGTVLPNRMIDFALALRKRVVMHWVGTDVTTAIRDYEAQVASKRCIEDVTHFCEVSWIQDELKQVGIDAQVVPIAAVDDQVEELAALPGQFCILSYAWEGREEFYGIERLARLAVEFPEIEIRIAGISRCQRSIPGNIKLLGWTENMREEYRNCVLYLRLPEHDGLSFSVLEALSHGRYVGYSHRLPNTYFIDSFARLKDVVRDLYDAFKRGGLGVNHPGAEYVRSQHNRHVVLGGLASKLAEERRRA